MANPSRRVPKFEEKQAAKETEIIFDILQKNIKL